eukprot:4383372-Lingulodinium_polyedra.AAC.1
MQAQGLEPVGSLCDRLKVLIQSLLPDLSEEELLAILHERLASTLLYDSSFFKDPMIQECFDDENELKE